MDSKKPRLIHSADPVLDHKNIAIGAFHGLLGSQQWYKHENPEAFEAMAQLAITAADTFIEEYNKELLKRNR